MTRFAFLSGSFLLLCATAAFADEPPARKAGLWEITIVVGSDPPRVSRLCLDDATEANLNAKSSDTMKQICSRFEAHRAGNTYTQDSVCRPMRSTQTSHSVMTFKSDSEYTLVSTSHFDPPSMGQTETTTTQTGKWLGACEPDMKPGDMVADGHKMNIGAKP